MKILSVACFNLSSLRGKQAHRLDFEAAPLAGCGLFAISGPTGAGKTTLLDAVTLALYGETPRQKNGVALSSYGSTESWAEVVYEVGAGRFLARWSMQRANAKKQLDGTPKVRMEVAPYPIQEGGWQTQKVGESIAKNEELTGLTYAQFTRSVLLAQGGFAEFLRAKDDDRAELLERMTGTGIYKELSQKAHERLGREKNAQQRLQDQVGGMRLISAEDLAEKKAGLGVADEQRKQAQQTAESWKAQIDWHQRRAGLQDRAGQAASEVVKAQEALAGNEPQLGRLAAHEPAEKFALPWRDYQAATRQAEAAETERQGVAGQLTEASSRLTEASAATEMAQKAADTAAQNLTREKPALDAALAQLPNLETLTKNAAAAEDARQLNRRTANETTRQHQRLAQQTATDRAELVTLGLWLKANANDARLDGVLVRLEHLIAQQQRAKADYELRNTACELAKTALQQVKDEETNHLKNKENARVALAGLHEQQAQLLAQHAGLSAAATTRQIGLTGTAKQAKQALGNCSAMLIGKTLFRDHASRLQPGHECPLCGALEHPVSTRHMDVSEEAIEALQAEYARLEEALDMATAEQKQNEDLLVSLASQPQPAAAPDPAALALTLLEASHSAQLVLRDLAAMPAQVARLDGARQLHDGKASDAYARQEAARAQVLELEKQCKDFVQEGQQAATALEQLANEWNAAFERKQPQLLLEQLSKRADIFKSKKARHDKLEPELAAATATLAAFDTRLDELQAEADGLTAAWTKAATNRTACAAEIAAAHVGFDSPQVALAAWEKAAQAAHATLANYQKAAQRETDTVTLLTDREKTHATQRAMHQATADALLAQLRHDLPAAGLPPDPAALTAVLLPDHERDALRQLRQGLETALTTATSYQQRCTADLADVEAQQLSQEPPETAQLNWQTAHDLHLDLVKQYTLLENEIATEQANQLRHATLAQQLAAQAAETLRWRALHDLIGSADGTRFSRFAQGLTLARLVRLANDHLQQFSDRYRLRRKDSTSLALLVADAYDDCVREVSTLSGGETFLVSLALALGLSELASNAARIDSLFIDEGFGTLDADTLDVALTALGQLRDRGKTIGIITHVDADRLEGHLDTRVLVERMGPGSSRLRVLPAVEATAG